MLGQTGGAIYNEAWELIGMTILIEIADRQRIYEIPLEQVLRAPRSRQIPVQLVARVPWDRLGWCQASIRCAALI